jgi:tetratricopeptide (TPR) repeat protein
MADGQFKFRAFISYSHADEAWAKWLHKRLESYRVPSRLVGKPGARGVIPARIGRCFRDQSELAAASHLGETLQAALRDSQVLIVICSPRSATSHWVNEEIRYFRGLGRGDRIFALIVDGEPNASDPARECFPPALLRGDDGRVLSEPLAADARSSNDGKTEGFLKLAAGVLGVGFGELRQREHARRLRLMAITVVVSLTIAVVTIGLAISAFHARNEATLRRQQADELINFMLGDLKERLQSLGRLDVLDAAIGKAMTYIVDEAAADQDATALAQRISGLVAVSKILEIRERFPEATEVARQAVAGARELMLRKPVPTDAPLLLAIALEKHAYVMAQLPESAPAARPLVDESETLLAALPRTDDIRHVQGRLHMIRQLLHAFAGEEAEALKEATACVEILRPLARRPDASAQQLIDYLYCSGYRGWRMYMLDSVEEAAAVFSEIRQEHLPALALHERDANVEFALLVNAGEAVTVYTSIGQLDRAQQEAAEAVALGRRLVAHDPANETWRQTLGQVLYGQVGTERLLKNWSAVQGLADEAIPIYVDVVQRDPSTFRNELMSLYGERGYSFAMRGDLPKAIADWDTAAALLADSTSRLDRTFALSAQLHLWEWLEDRDPVRASAARSAAENLLEAVAASVDPTVSYQVLSLKRSRMRYAYLSGDAAAGDQLYGELRAASRFDLAHPTATRQHLCERLARRKGQRCAPDA